MCNVLHLSCIPASAPVRVVAKGMLVHELYSSSSASHWVKKLCFFLVEKLAACKLLLVLRDQHSSFATHALSRGDGAPWADPALQWAPRGRVCACIPGFQTRWVLRPGLKPMDQSIRMYSFTVSTGSSAFTIKLLHLHQAWLCSQIYGQWLRPCEVTISCFSLSRDPAVMVHILIC